MRTGAEPMSREIFQSVESWCDDFFRDFVSFRNGIYGAERGFLEECIDPFRILFKDSVEVTSGLWQWRALLLRSVAGAVLGRMLMCYSTDDAKKVLNCGYFECENDARLAARLFDHAIEYARERGLTVIKAPVQANFFVSYRMRIGGDGPPFYGEPFYKDYYPDLFRACGLHVANTWQTTRLRPWHTVKNFLRINRALGGRVATFSELKVRNLDMRRWDAELALMHGLFHESYRDMPEFAPMSLATFRALYNDFRYLASPRFSYFVEHRGRPVGFCINFFDALPALRMLERMRGGVLAPFAKLLALLRLKLSRGTLLITYVGRIPSPTGDEIKGVQAKVSRRIIASTLGGLLVRRLLVCFSAQDSNSKRSFAPDTYVPYATYALFRKDVGS